MRAGAAGQRHRRRRTRRRSTAAREVRLTPAARPASVHLSTGGPARDRARPGRRAGRQERREVRRLDHPVAVEGRGVVPAAVVAVLVVGQRVARARRAASASSRSSATAGRGRRSSSARGQRDAEGPHGAAGRPSRGWAASRSCRGLRSGPRSPEVHRPRPDGRTGARNWSRARSGKPRRQGQGVEAVVPGPDLVHPVLRHEDGLSRRACPPGRRSPTTACRRPGWRPGVRSSRQGASSVSVRRKVWPRARARSVVERGADGPASAPLVASTSSASQSSPRHRRAGSSARPGRAPRRRRTRSDPVDHPDPVATTGLVRGEDARRRRPGPRTGSHR